MNQKAKQRRSSPTSSILGPAVLVLLMVGAEGVRAEMCLPDCPNDTWEEPQQSTEIELPGGCIVRVFWAKREACGLYQDVHIAGTSPINFEHPSCVALSQMNEKDYLEMVTELLLVENPMGFDPGGPGCNTIWRVVNGSCWSKRFHLEDSAVFAPCQTTACCLKHYQVCVDACSNVSVEPLGPGSGGSSSCPVEIYPCVPVCG